ncbi:MAG TPA: VWA domain-containing protein [Polyangiaceae bacterium]|nr:VWA domain-containing protein [Polyangiaceae bacterium]
MKPTRVAVFAALGMLLTSASVYSLTPAPGSSPGRDILAVGEAIGVNDAPGGDQTELARFTAGQNLMIEGRVGHPKIARNSRGETFVLLEVKGSDTAKAKTAAPVNLAIVMDRSGSMKGSRLPNAIRAATAAVDRLNEGDTVSVITFDTRTSIVVPPTEIGPGSRERVNSDIRRISLGGDTCISCGIEDGLAQIERTMGKVNKMILLSDGDANHGVRDVGGFRAIAERARERNTPITSIGVDVDYNENILSAISIESNGRHYFVENDSALARVFEDEAERLTETVASNAEVTIDLAPGVELDRVFDRSFRRSGNRVTVPLGTFASGEQKTVLLKVRMPARSNGEQALAGVELAYRDLIANTDTTCGGKLGVEITDDASEVGELDPVVEGRVRRSETASVLKSANALFAAGRVDDAKRKLEEQEQSLKDVARKAKAAAPATRAADVERDFQSQVAAVNEANNGFGRSFATPPQGVFAEPAAGGSFAQAPAAAAPPPPAQSREGKSAVKRNLEKADAFGF